MLKFYDFMLTVHKPTWIASEVKYILQIFLEYLRYPIREISMTTKLFQPESLKWCASNSSKFGTVFLFSDSVLGEKGFALIYRKKL